MMILFVLGLTFQLTSLFTSIISNTLAKSENKINYLTPKVLSTLTNVLGLCAFILFIFIIFWSILS